MDHVGLLVSNLEKAQAFFDASLAPLGAKRGMNFGTTSLYVNGKNGVFFAINQKEHAKHQEGAHYAFAADSTAEVDAWYDASIKAGAKDNGKAGPRPAYGPNFYGAFVLDPVDGHHLECCFKKYQSEESKKDAPKPKLYYYFGTRAMRTIWMAQECGVALDMHPIDLQKGEHKKPEYIKINPYGTVPTLVDGDDVLTNSVSSSLYLSRKYGGEKFVAKRLDAPEFVTSIDRFDDAIIKAFLNAVVYPADKRDKEVVKTNHEFFNKSVMPHWNSIAEKMGTWAMGEQFTVVDVIWGYLLNIVVSLEWITEKDHPKLFAYTQRLRDRPAFKATFDRSNAMYSK
jgi:glutathione S-transferase/predicted lactoylglutathione lyase